MSFELETSESQKKNEESKLKVEYNPIIVHKFVVEFQIYPNGSVFSKMYPIGKSSKHFKKKKKALQKLSISGLKGEKNII